MTLLSGKGQHPVSKIFTPYLTLYICFDVWVFIYLFINVFVLDFILVLFCPSPGWVRRHAPLHQTPRVPRALPGAVPPPWPQEGPEEAKLQEFRGRGG